MKSILIIFVLFFSSPLWAWWAERAGCRSQNFPSNPNVITYTSVDWVVGPQAQAVLRQTTRLENASPNVLLGETQYEKFAFFTEKRKINPDQSIFAGLFGTPYYEGYALNSGTLYTDRGAAKMARVDVTFTKRYSDGEPHDARVDIYVRENANLPWTLSESYNDCHVTVVH